MSSVVKLNGNCNICSTAVHSCWNVVVCNDMLITLVDRLIGCEFSV